MCKKKKKKANNKEMIHVMGKYNSTWLDKVDFHS